MKTSVYLLSCGLICAGLACQTADKKRSNSTRSPKLAGIETDWEGEAENEEPEEVVVSVSEKRAKQAQGSDEQVRRCTAGEDDFVKVLVFKGETGPDVIVKVLCEIAAKNPCFRGRLRPHPNPNNRPNKGRMRFSGKDTALLDSISINGMKLTQNQPAKIGGDKIIVKLAPPGN